MRFTEACLLKTENNMTTLSEPLVTPKYGKWRQLVLGLICMAAISSPQYVWTLLTKPLSAKLGVGLPELQVTFSLLIILQTFFSPFQGRLVEKFGPRRLIAIGTVMAGMSWVLSAQVNGLATLWLVYGCMGGLGTGIVYIGVVGLMVKMVPTAAGICRRRGGGGLRDGGHHKSTFPISPSLTTNGLEHTMTTFGILFRPRRLHRQSGAEAAAARCLPARQSDGGAEQQIVYFPGNAAPATVLADVRHDGDDVDFRADGHFADGGVRRGFRH